jgi:DNA polymerase epsilon subunit 2
MHQRLMRNAAFAPPVLGQSKEMHVHITPIESVASSEGALCLFGMLTQPEEGMFCLEDTRDRIPLDLSSATTVRGLFTETCVVLVQGVFRAEDEVFVVHMMGFPPAERRDDSMVAMGRVDTMDVIHTPDEYAKMLELQSRAVDTQFVVVSDVHLDDAGVVSSLRDMFAGFEASGTPPAMFVLIGNFSSKPFGQSHDDRESFVRNLDALGTLIATFPTIAAASRFVFVPGPSDPGASGVLPRPPVRAGSAAPPRRRVAPSDCSSRLLTAPLCGVCV